MTPKTVCIVGAGPSGLVAAKNLLHRPGASFSVTVFDPKPRVGGLWPSEKHDGDGLVHPLMVANQSKHTVQFSDLAWEEGAPQLPRAWQVGRYLQRYLSKYCAFEEDRFRLRLGWRVEKAVPVSGSEERRWAVTAKSEEGLLETTEYDYLLIASGFFGNPVLPEIPGLSAVKDIPVVHSSRYRDLQTLLPDADGKGGKILIVGGQMSGVEIAGTIASHLSHASNMPGSSILAGAENYTIHHVIQRPIWVFPLFTTPAAGRTAASFLPLDLSSYNLANRPKPLVNTQGHITVEAAKNSHAIYQGALGTDQSEFSPLLASNPEAQEEPPYLAVSDWYTEFVRSGLISVIHGKLKAVSGNTATLSSMSSENGPTVLDDIAAIVLATGFEAIPSLSFLPTDIQETLSVDSTDLANTLLLGFHGTQHPKVPNLGFVGFYRSPYWGVMEMQARFLTELWFQQQQGALEPSMQNALANDVSINHFAGLRGDVRSSQFPMGDYAFLMQEFAAALGIEISGPVGETPPLPHNGKSMDILTPARYVLGDATAAMRAEASTSLHQTHETALSGLTRGKYVARAVFRSLSGEWQLERDLVSKLPSHPTGHWSGTARFLLRQGTKDGRQCADPVNVESGKEDQNQNSEEEDSVLEYLYIEEGEFKTTAGLSFQATRRYVWRYDERTDRLSVWFVRTGDKFSRKDPRRDEEQMRADYLFHEVEFIVPEGYGTRSDDDGSKHKGWEAKAGHLCVEDFYDVKYDFNFKAVNLRDWRLSYTVKGPQKDYTIDGTYMRKAR